MFLNYEKKFLTLNQYTLFRIFNKSLYFLSMSSYIIT